jgi:predicted HTH transcriptional regulator
MNQTFLSELVSMLRSQDEITWIEAKDSLGDPIKIGETISALANSASYANQEYGYIVWGLQDGTWDIVGTEFSLRKFKHGNQD